MKYESKRKIRFCFGNSYNLVYVNEKELKILYLYVEESLRSYGLGTLLLLHSIMITKEFYPCIVKVTLDDCSDNVCSVKHNIYRNIGFRFKQKAKYDKVNKIFIIQGGPERELSLSKHSLFYRYYLKKWWKKKTKSQSLQSLLQTVLQSLVEIQDN